MTVFRLAAAILLLLCTNAIGQTSFWTSSSIPNVPEVANTSPVTLGLKFYSDVSGFITGVRFYKGSTNTGLHTGNLWSSTGTNLASVTFSGESNSGWQQANFSAPVSIAANITYIISYTAPNGGHAHDQNFAWSTLSSGSLHIAGSTPGVFTYGSGVQFPTSTWLSSNYWVDVIFSPANQQMSFWPNTAVPNTPQVTNTAAVSLGLQFYSDVAGSIRGLRFYKGSRNTGKHVGTLWSATGTKIASVTFSGETASGWQQANFSVPINISANNVYVISYTAPKGSHAHDVNYPWSSLSSASLHVSGSSPGLYVYGTGVLFPRNASLNSNYWVDVVFKPALDAIAPPPPSTYTISGTVSGASATVTLSGPVSGSVNTDATSGAYSFTGLPNGLYVVTPGSTGFTFNPVTATVTINGTSIAGVNFTASAVPSPIPHSITLSWNPSNSSNVVGYNIYRADTAGGAYAKVNQLPIPTTAFVDSAILSGRTYYYVATAVDSNNSESVYSSQAIAVVPTP